MNRDTGDVAVVVRLRPVQPTTVVERHEKVLRQVVIVLAAMMSSRVEEGEALMD